MGAQAAVAALTLAVTLFVMQGVNNRRDIDERMYREYVRRSWVKGILRNSLLAVGLTGAVLLTEKLVSGTETASSIMPGLPYLILIAVAAFVINLVLAATLFERALHLSRPDQWMDIRRHVNERDVRQALQAYVKRRARAVASLLANQPDITAVFPDPGEGSADEAVKELLDEARKSMREGRQGEFTKSINSITKLLTYAADEIEKTNISWSPPGTQPEWPPLRELGRNLYSFREDVIKEGSRDHVLELLRLDYWLVCRGMERRCGEMFTVGLVGYRVNYQIANQHGGAELRAMLRDRFGLNANALIYMLDAGNLFPYMKEIINHQEVMLSDAMHLGQLDDFRRLHTGLNSLLRSLGWHWNVDGWPEPPEAELHSHLEQEYRIALMGLAGKAALTDQARRINSADAYLDIAREQYTNAEELANDIAHAINSEDRRENQLWSLWEMEDVPQGEAHFIQTEQYPLAFFAIRLTELATTRDGTLNLRGTATKVLEWFSQNSERVQHLVQIDPETTMERRRELALEALRLAVHQDEVAEEYNTIQRNLSPERVSAFIEGIRTEALQANPIEETFHRAGSYLHLPSGSEGMPTERGVNRLEPKAYLAEDSKTGRIYYEPLKGDRWGRDLAYGITLMLCTALDEAPRISVPLNSPRSMLHAVDDVADELACPDELLLVVAGDWFEVEVALNTEKPEGYTPQWQLHEPQMSWRIGRYRGHPIVRGPRDRDRRLYIVDPKTWGLFVRGQFEGGEDVKVEVTSVSAERALELLNSNPDYFSEEPDQESKLRKLQSTVQIQIGIQQEFQVKDPSRARLLIDGTDTEQQTFSPAATGL